MKLISAILLSLSVMSIHAQNNSGTSFYGQMNARAGLCPERLDALSEKDVNSLVTNILWKSYHIKNSYIILNCTEVANCQAAVFEGKPYILYNPNFLGKVKKLNFSQAALPSVTDKDWETLTILAHELGHHLNGHLTNPKPDARQWDQELEADETAGFIIHLMGGTVSQAQMAFRDIPEEGDYTHPGRQRRLDAVAKGWNDATPVAPVNPVKNDEPNTVTDVDGNIYKTIQIGSQLWMQSNLNVTQFRNGTAIPEVKTAEDWKKACDAGQPAWCYYNNDPANGKKYGRLYNWFAVSDTRGLVPAGYHIPSKEEWNQLAQFAGINGAELLIEMYPRTQSTNKTGFTALQGGARSPEGLFEYAGENGRWWCADDENRNGGFLSGRELTPGVSVISKLNLNKWYGLAVRCIKDAFVYLPNAFSPNNDGVNDVAKPDMTNIKTLKNFAIYNRWGQRVFFTDKAGEGWDGKFNGKLQDTGIYTWILEFIDTEGMPASDKGTITLVR